MNNKKLLLILFILSIILIFEISLTKSNILKKENNEYVYINNQPELYYNIINFEVINPKIYMALNDIKPIKYKLEFDSNYEEILMVESKNEKVASLDEFNNIIANGYGSTIIELKIKDEIRKIEVLVTKLIEKMPETYNKQKRILTCDIYSESENDLLDKILESRVEEAGLKTRAGVVAAARFITLEFPYKIGYFSENGRLATHGYTYNVDGEGRYYHKGLYLHKSRFKDITYKMYGPSTWGCSLYSYVTEASRRNGLDCSGFIAWILYNGGFDPGDLGAGISNVITDMTDLGIKIDITKSINNNSLKVGDLLSGPNSNGGHIAMLIGKKNNMYYVAESLWGNGDFGAIIRIYNSENIDEYFKWHIDMDSYYLEDGNYTEYWT